MVCGGKKGCPRERNLREIYTENTIMFCLLLVFCFVFAYTELNTNKWRGAQNFLGPRGVKYLNTGLLQQAKFMANTVCKITKNTFGICRAAFPKLWSANHRWCSGSALVVLLD
jgi:hypothetical protein